MVSKWKDLGVFWRTVIGVGAVLSVLATAYGIDSLYVRNNYFSICQAQTKEAIAQTKETIGGVQQQIQVQRAYDEVYFWQKMEIELSLAVAAHPTDQALKTKLEKVQQSREAAEERLNSVKGGK